MKSGILVIICFLSHVFIFGQGKNPLIEQFANTITEYDAKTHLSFLADDLLEGRETGEKGQKLAAHYIKTQFMRLGLQAGVPANDSYYQIYYLNKSEVRDVQMGIGKESFSFGEDFFPIGSPMAESIVEDFLFVGYGISEPGYDNLDGLDLDGKTLIAFAGSPKGKDQDLRQKFQDWSDRVQAMVNRGAEGVVMILDNNDFRSLARFASRKSTSVGDQAEIVFPLIYISEKMGEAFLTAAKAKSSKLKSQLANQAKVPSLSFKKLDFSYQADLDNKSIPVENVLGYLEGTDKKDELLVLTAHYDHIGVGSNGDINNGADDDASGTTAILELAEAFVEATKAGHRPRRSILFMTVSGEEKGLLGSQFYAENPIYPLGQTIANLNIDMVGRIGSQYQGSPDSLNYVYVIGSDKLSTDLHAINESANETYTQMKLDYTYNDDNDPNRFYYRSDHYNFAKNGIPVIFYFNGTHNDYHRPSDTIEKITFSKMVKTTKLVFATAWELANREDRIRVNVN